jgi:hypothetical protein
MERVLIRRAPLNPFVLWPPDLQSVSVLAILQRILPDRLYALASDRRRIDNC